MTRTTAPHPIGGLVAQLAATGGGEAMARVAQLLAVALLGQTLGATGLGTVGLAWSLTALALAAVQGGPELAGVRLLGLDATGAPAPVIAATTALKFRLALLAIPILFATQWVIGHDDLAAVSQLAAQSLATLAMVLGYAWAFRGLCRPADQAMVRMIQAFGGLALLWLILQIWPSPLAAPVAEGGAAIVAAFIGWRRLKPPGTLMTFRHDGPQPPIPGLLASSLALGATNLAATLGWVAPVLAAARWATIEDVSYLTGALRLLLGCVGIMQIGFQAIYPLMVRCHARDHRAGAGLNAALAVQCALVTTGGVVILTLIAGPLTTWLLGDDFAVAGELLAALAPILTPIALSSPISYALMARGEDALIARIAIVAAALTAVACLFSFQTLPGPWGVLALHVTTWGQMMAIIIVGHRQGVLARPETGWRGLIDVPGVIRRLSAATAKARPPT